jgi:hypothetical protein
MSLIEIARYFLILGLILLVLGTLLYLVARVELPIGRLPGDIRIERERFTCLIPLATSILLSILLTIGLNLIIRLINR